MLGCAAAPASMAFSLYDTAPSVGMPESYAIKYSVDASIGYDDNLNSTSHHAEDGFFTQFGVRARYSDQESATRVSYDVRLGGRLYDKAAAGTDRKLFSESSASASLSHSFSAASVYTTTLRASLSTEPNFASGISAAYTQTENFSWAWSHAYSQAIDARWSWTLDASYSGVTYTRGEYQEDDRQYLRAGLTLSYRYSSLTTYNISTSYSHGMRRVGEGADSVYLNVGVNHSLSPISSIYASVGTQCKFVADNTDLYPTFRFGYRRQIVEGLSANIYVSLDNENIDTGYNASSMYLSDQTIRTGADLSYALSHKVTFYVDGSLLFRDYSKHTAGLADRSDTTWVLGLGMRYKFTEHLTGSIDYKYTSADRDYGDYDRNRISTGVIYTF